MDVVVLCGGYGTRLAGLWDGPKCLVPLANGRSILDHLLRRVHALQPRLTTLVTGYKSREVSTALSAMGYPRSGAPMCLVREQFPDGTAAAVRRVLGLVEPPVLVLNGDTLPRYDLRGMLGAWHGMARPSVLTAWCAGKAAGAVILGALALERLPLSAEKNLEEWIRQEDFVSHYRLGVKGFLDVGTPEGYALGRQWVDNTEEAA